MAIEKDEGQVQKTMARRDFLRLAAVMGASAGLLGGALQHAVAAPGSLNGLPRRRLGKTEHHSSVIAFGGVALNGVALPRAREEVVAAIEAGVNHFDVAPSYGDSETRLGAALQGLRDKVFLACKTLERDRDGARRELEMSLQRLQTDHFDLYQFHAVDTVEDLERICAPGGALETFLRARDQGLIRAIGLTGHFAPTQVLAIERLPLDTIMVPVDFVDRFYFGAETGLLSLARERDIGVIAIKSTYRGKVKDKRAAYRYTLSLPVATTIPAGNLEEIRQAIDIARSFTPMTAEEMTLLLQGSEELGDEVCRQCEHCMPCPQGINIPLTFALEGFALRYRREQAAMMYAGMSTNATACVECGQCSAGCPYHIDVPARLRHAHAVLAG